MMETPRMEFKLPKARLETLVDGIFAIAMTILVLEVKVPVLQNRRSPEELLAAFSHDWPTVAAYFVSFGMLSIYWVWHHRIAAKIKELDGALLACSVVFLALVSFFPYVAGVLGRYPTNPFSLALYFPVLGLLLLSQTAFFWLAMVRGKLWEEVSLTEARIIHRRNLKGFIIFCLASLPGVLRLGSIPALVALGIALASILAYRRA